MHGPPDARCNADFQVCRIASFQTCEPLEGLLHFPIVHPTAFFRDCIPGIFSTSQVKAPLFPSRPWPQVSHAPDECYWAAMKDEAWNRH
jgi:hypothetical protein